LCHTGDSLHCPVVDRDGLGVEEFCGARGGAGGIAGGALPPQVCPLSAIELGLAFVPLKLAWKPKLTVAPAGIVPFQAALRTLTPAPLCVARPFHRLVIR